MIKVHLLDLLFYECTIPDTRIWSWSSHYAREESGNLRWLRSLCAGPTQRAATEQTDVMTIYTEITVF